MKVRMRRVLSSTFSVLGLATNLSSAWFGGLRSRGSQRLMRSPVIAQRRLDHRVYKLSMGVGQLQQQELAHGFALGWRQRVELAMPRRVPDRPDATGRRPSASCLRGRRPSTPADETASRRGRRRTSCCNTGRGPRRGSPTSRASHPAHDRTPAYARRHNHRDPALGEGQRLHRGRPRRKRSGSGSRRVARAQSWYATHWPDNVQAQQPPPNSHSVVA